MFLFYLAFLAYSLPHLCAAGPNAEVEIDLTPSSPPCGLEADSAIELSLAARNMSGVRQITLEFSWAPPEAIASAFGTLGTTTEEKFFITPGPPQVEGNRAKWGMAVFGDEGLTGAGQLAHLGFELAAGINPETPVDIHFEFISLGPSFTERDTIRPIQAVALANYCDEKGQALERGLFLRPQQKEFLFSPMGTGHRADESAGEAHLEARLFEAGHFSVGEVFTWDIDNRGPGPVYALIDGGPIRIEAGTLQQIPTTSDARGNAHLLLDSESGADTGTTTIALRACSRAESICANGQVIWQSPTTAVLSPQGGSQLQELLLAPNYPNPFNAGTILSFSIPAGNPRFVQLDIFNIAGQKVATPFAANATPGRHAIQWDGRSSTGQHAASGLYTYRLRTDSAERHRTMLLLR